MSAVARQARPTEGHCDVVLGLPHQPRQLRQDRSFRAQRGAGLHHAGPDGAGRRHRRGLRRQPRQRRAARRARSDFHWARRGGPPSLFGPDDRDHGCQPKRRQSSSALDGDPRKLSIPGITDVTVEGRGRTRRHHIVWLDNVTHPYSGRLAAARGTSSHYKDHSLAFDNSGATAISRRSTGPTADPVGERNAVIIAMAPQPTTAARRCAHSADRILIWGGLGALSALAWLYLWRMPMAPRRWIGGFDGAADACHAMPLAIGRRRYGSPS